jgi:2-C-methyl-D-erythritol 2,4-cyclodiphosphate synthase
MRVGIGYDVHKLVTGRPLVLGGVQIQFEKGLSGYSDADVVTHAIMDSLLGAAGLKDIGTHFPPGDPLYKNISSLVLLSEVKKLITAKGFKINNIDAVIITELPKMAPYIDTMRQTLSHLLDITLEQLMVKASTNDKLGSIGKGQGIAAYAIASLDQISMLE